MRGLLTAFILFPFMLCAQALRMTVSTDNILIGGQFQAKFEGPVPGNDASRWLQFDSLQHFEILEKSPVSSFETGGQKIFSQTFRVTSFDSGRWVFPGVLPGGFRVKPQMINVSFSPFDSAQPYHDVKDIMGGEAGGEDRKPWYLLVLVVLIIFFVLLFQRKKKEDKWQPDEGAYKRALKKLDQLKASPDKDSKVLFTEVIQIFREYLYARKNIVSHSKTTDDLAVKLTELKLPKAEYEELLKTLRMSDLVKFARFQPGEGERVSAVENIKHSITTIERL